MSASILSFAVAALMTLLIGWLTRLIGPLRAERPAPVR
jgi:hypothetical protein